MTNKEFVKVIRSSEINIDSTNGVLSVKLSPENIVECIKFLIYDLDVDDNLASNIIKYRAEHNMTQTQFANMIGVTTPIIVNIEKGRGCSQVTAQKIKNAIMKNRYWHIRTQMIEYRQ